MKRRNWRSQDPKIPRSKAANEMKDDKTESEIGYKKMVMAKEARKGLLEPY